MKQDVFLMGSVFVDIICAGLTRYPREGEEVFVDTIETSPGGTAITALVLNKLGIAAGLAGVVGDDFYSQYLFSQLKEAGVSTDFLLVEQQEDTGVSICIPTSGDRSFISRRDPNMTVYSARLMQKIDVSQLHKGASVHINFTQLRTDPVEQFLRQHNHRTGMISTDIGHEEARNWSEDDFARLSLVDWFFPNEREAEYITGTDRPADMLAILGRYVSHPVITLGKRGALAFNQRGTPLLIPPVSAKPLNPSGSGDSFTAGLIYGLHRGLSPVDALLMANIVGGLSTESLLSYNRDITAECVEKHFEQLQTEVVKI
ncbi:MAG: carbohydrate kinase family protein [Spirochaetota bacterium]